MNVLFWGCGNMGGALLQAWRPLLGNMWQNVWVLRMAKWQRQKLQDDPAIHLLADLAELRAVRQHFDLIVLGMKPQVIRQQMENCLCFDSSGPDGRSLWLTMAAGLPLSWYQERQAGLRILRLMPNLGASSGQSASLLYKSPDLLLSQKEQNMLEQMAQLAGVSVWCHTEAQLENATPITGSGPAYFYLLTEALQAELEKQGFVAGAAASLAEATFLGAAACLAERAQEGQAALLRRAVTSKAGVTEAALSLLSPELTAILAKALARGRERNSQLQNDNI